MLDAAARPAVRPDDQRQSADGGAASVECDSTRQVARADASYGGGLADRGLSVASSSFHAKAWRDPRLGVVTQAVAEADRHLARERISVGVPLRRKRCPERLEVGDEMDELLGREDAGRAPRRH